MKKTIFVFLSVLMTTLLTGCFTFVGQEYQPSFINIDKLSVLAAKSRTIKLAEFTGVSGAKVSMNCSIEGTVYIASDGKTTVAKYLRDALIDELRHEKLYSDKSGAMLYVNVDKIDMNYPDGYWIIQMTFNDGKNPPYSIVEKYEFENSICRNASYAFKPAVQQFLFKLYQSPGFVKTLSS